MINVKFKINLLIQAALMISRYRGEHFLLITAPSNKPRFCEISSKGAISDIRCIYMYIHVFLSQTSYIPSISKRYLHGCATGVDFVTVRCLSRATSNSEKQIIYIINKPTIYVSGGT